MAQITLKHSDIADKTLRSQLIFTNVCAVSPQDFPHSRKGPRDQYVMLRGPRLAGGAGAVFTYHPVQGLERGRIYLSEVQRGWAGISIMDQFTGERYDASGAAYLGTVDVEAGFASTKSTTDQPFSSDELEQAFLHFFRDQILTLGQKLLMDIRNIKIALTVKRTDVADLSALGGNEKPAPRQQPGQAAEVQRGLLTPETHVNFFKAGGSPINITGSDRRPATSSIIAPDFSFGSLGIGGVDEEVRAIFRRAFASRVLPPGIVEKLGIKHCKGILLYGPPGTGKTLIARKIGQALNSREPKIVNGPELLNKFVGQSEENVRKLFIDAEKEYKEKGDESGLHIIIFDELDAVCRQRGGGGGGAGSNVGDNIVNQLLTKLDGVEQLNNVLLIGMTNRRDLIDEALLRPGRLDMGMEISLPNEAGREQIFTIHTQHMRDNGRLARDVDCTELASLSRNYSGAEIAGTVSAAASFAMNRHISVEKGFAVKENVVDMTVTRQDFLQALNEVRPAHGVSEDSLRDATPYGMIHFSPGTQINIDILLSAIESVRIDTRRLITSVLLHGPRGSGKTALAAHVALASQIPFTKIITPASLVQMAHDGAKRDYINRVFSEAYRSPLSMVILDSIEDLIEYIPNGPRFSQSILATILTLVNTPPPKGRRMLVLATTSRRYALDQLGAIEMFRRHVAVPAVASVNELAAILTDMRVFAHRNELDLALERVGELASGQVGVGIQQVVGIAGYAALQREKQLKPPAEILEEFVDELSAQMAMAGTGGSLQ